MIYAAVLFALLVPINTPVPVNGADIGDYDREINQISAQHRAPTALQLVGRLTPTYNDNLRSVHEIGRQQLDSYRTGRSRGPVAKQNNSAALNKAWKDFGGKGGGGTATMPKNQPLPSSVYNQSLVDKTLGPMR